MKVIDLLNKIANGEIKDKTIFRINWGHIYRDFYYDSNEENQLQCLKNCSDDYSLYDDIKLNDEVDVLEDTPKEDKKIEKLDYCEENTFMKQKETTYLSQKERLLLDSNFKELGKKINEIIDKINGE